MTAQTAEQQILENEENLTQPSGFSFDSQLFVAVISGPIGGVIFALFHSYYLRTLKKSFYFLIPFIGISAPIIYFIDNRLVSFVVDLLFAVALVRSHYYFCKEEQDAMVESGQVKNPWVAGILISLAGFLAELCIDLARKFAASGHSFPFW